MANVFVQLFGEELRSGSESVKTAEALKGKVVGLYFSAHWCPPCRGFTPKLAQAYTKSLADKGFEVVFVSSDKDQEAFDDYFKEMPWKALPYEARDLKDTLSKKFKVQGIPSLIILDEQGQTIVTDGRSAVMGDPDGEDFPWHPKPFAEVIGSKFVGHNEAELDKKAVEGKVLGLYFSAHWCPPCRTFTPKLAAWYKEVSPKLPDFEIVFVSSDRSESDFKEYFAEMPWIAVPLADRKRKEALSELFGVEGIPTLVIVDKDGSTITTTGRGIPQMDPTGAQFPWYPRPLRDLANGPDGLQETPSLVVFMDGVDDATRATACAALEAVAGEYKAKAKETGEDALLFFFGGPGSVNILNALRRLSDRPIALTKHEHPLEKKDREGCRCDGCSKEIEGEANNCGECDFDYCNDCDVKAVEDGPGQPLLGVLFDLDAGRYTVVEDVDFLSADSIRTYAAKFIEGSVEMSEIKQS